MYTLHLINHHYHPRGVCRAAPAAAWPEVGEPCDHPPRQPAQHLFAVLREARVQRQT